MHGLTMFALLIMFGMIYGVGHWLWIIHRHIRTRTVEADSEHAELRDVAERAASDAASCAAVIDKFEVMPQPHRRRMHVVRDDERGVPTWKWE